MRSIDSKKLPLNVPIYKRPASSIKSSSIRKIHRKKNNHKVQPRSSTPFLDTKPSIFDDSSPYHDVSYFSINNNINNKIFQSSQYQTVNSSFSSSPLKKRAFKYKSTALITIE